MRMSIKVSSSMFHWGLPALTNTLNINLWCCCRLTHIPSVMSCFPPSSIISCHTPLLLSFPFTRLHLSFSVLAAFSFRHPFLAHFISLSLSSLPSIHNCFLSLLFVPFIHLFLSYHLFLHPHFHHNLPSIPSALHHKFPASIMMTSLLSLIPFLSLPPPRPSLCLPPFHPR